MEQYFIFIEVDSHVNLAGVCPPPLLSTLLSIKTNTVLSMLKTID